MGNVMASSKTSSLPATLRDAPPEQLATFGAGCFWGTEKYFKDFGKAHGGLVDMRVGFMGDANAQKNPSYRDVCTGQSGHVEVLQLRFDPAKVSYASLVDHFFTFHDPTTLNRQGNDAGPQYASVIFAHTPEQAEVAKQRAAALQKLMDDGTIRPGAFTTRPLSLPPAHCSLGLLLFPLPEIPGGQPQRVLQPPQALQLALDVWRLSGR